ncbi:hypothetical protein KDH_79250 [Dictyobacter sp. S3.2.2.5]|uniref:Uncharacterized protein n=1 Tax=Dictyobacter halimunensis TaxID=3026934 RepID=A0ABQ6G3J5_9CHLR|nr:hypothetical protein KDH_79250 [Dictyobacter sp. S3.2.2.5]
MSISDKIFIILPQGTAISKETLSSNGGLYRLEQVVIVQTVGRGGINFDDLAVQRHRRETTLHKTLLVFFQPFYIWMPAVPTLRTYACHEALNEDGAICLA